MTRTDRYIAMIPESSETTETKGGMVDILFTDRKGEQVNIMLHRSDALALFDDLGGVLIQHDMDEINKIVAAM